MAVEEKQGNEKVPKKGKVGKYKWYLVAGMGIIAVLVFVFVRKSNANASGQTAGSANTSLDPATQAALQSALQGQAYGSMMQGSAGAQGPPGPQGPPGTQGPPGPPPKPPPKPPPPPIHDCPRGSHKVGGKCVPITVPPVKKGQYYTVKSGDTLSGIASRLNYSGGWQALYHANRQVVGSNPNMIHPGLRLKVS